MNFSQKDAVGNRVRTVELHGTLSGTPERAYPRFKSTLVLDWIYSEFLVSLTTRYVNSLTEPCRDLADLDVCSDESAVDPNVLSTNELSATVYNDLQVTWTPKAVDNNLTLTAGVNNLFNIDPPSCYSCSLNGFNGIYDVPGIFGYVTAGYTLK